MKKIDVIKLVNAGIISMTAYELSPAHHYKAFKLKKEVEKAYREIEDEQRGIREEHGITEELVDKVRKIVEKSQQRKEVTDVENAIVTDYNEKSRTANKVIEFAAEQEINLDIKTIPFLEWRKLQAENRAKKIGDKEVDILGGIAEIILADVFWIEPQEEEITENK